MFKQPENICYFKTIFNHTFRSISAIGNNFIESDDSRQVISMSWETSLIVSTSEIFKS